ncbi:hypothetical protein JRB95_001377 [Listeria monocytogenes]|nr:hypothetical protein [Listeria monocytogenes]
MRSKENKTKVKVGDIVKNNWAGHPYVRYFIYLGTFGDKIHGYRLSNGKLEKSLYSKQGLYETIPFSEKPAYEVVGHTDAFNLMKQDLGKFVNPDLEIYKNEVSE